MCVHVPVCVCVCVCGGECGGRGVVMCTHGGKAGRGCIVGASNTRPKDFIPCPGEAVNNYAPYTAPPFPTPSPGAEPKSSLLCLPLQIRAAVFSHL